MDRPELVTATLDGESVDAAIEIGGGDAVYVTPTRVIVYRADGLLTDESVEAFALDVDRLAVGDGRRKATIRLVDPERGGEFSIPTNRTDAIIEAVLGGMLQAASDVEPDEELLAVHRFSELTLVLTDARLLKHVGGDVWGPDREAYSFADTTDLRTEEGTHATQLVIEVDGRPQRVKVPADQAVAVRREIERALFAAHGVDSREAFEATVGPADADGDGPADADGDEQTDTTAEGVPSFDLGEPEQTAVTGDPNATNLADRVAALEAAVERQSTLLEEQRDLIEQLVEELRRGR